MTIEGQIRDEKLQYDINREAAKISALSSGKTDKYEYLTGEEILPSNQQQIIEQAKFTYSPLGKAFEKETKTIKDQGEKQIKTIEEESNKQIKNIKNKWSDKTIKTVEYDPNDDQVISKQKGTYNKMVNEERDNIEEIDFSKYISYIDMMIGIRDGDISLAIAVLNQNNLSNE